MAEKTKQKFELEYKDELKKYNAWVHIGIDEGCESYVLSVMFPNQESLHQADSDGAFSVEEYPRDKPRAIVQFVVTPDEWRKHYV